MAHRVQIENIGALRPYMDVNVARDFIDLFYRGPDTCFTIDGSLREKRTRGRHLGHYATGHKIELSGENIIRDFKRGLPVGGNMKPWRQDMAVFMTFAHELQHANQTLTHSHNEGFFTKPGYRRRPCEVDARLFVDENMGTIAAFLGIEAPTRCLPKDQVARNYDLELVSLAEDLSEFEELSVGDIREELREAGLNDPVTLGKLRTMLQLRGVLIVK